MNATIPKWLDSEKDTIKEWWRSANNGTYTGSFSRLNLYCNDFQQFGVAIINRFNTVESANCDNLIKLIEEKLFNSNFNSQKEIDKFSENTSRELLANNLTHERSSLYYYMANCWLLSKFVESSEFFISRICVSYSHDSMRIKKDVVHEQAKMVYLAFSPNFNIESRYKTSDVVSLSRRIFYEKDWGAMPILADALQEAGFDKTEPLAKLRDSKTYWFRGCKILSEILTS